MNGGASGYVTPSTVTCRSSMASRSADWVLGEARLISSPSTRLAKMAPGRKSKLPVARFQTVEPTTSDGRRSGVNWMRPQRQSSDVAKALARLVLPTPGTSSTRRWPSATRQRRASSITSALPCTTRPTLSATAVKTSAKDESARAAPELATDRLLPLRLLAPRRGDARWAPGQRLLGGGAVPSGGGRGAGGGRRGDEAGGRAGQRGGVALGCHRRGHASVAGPGRG